MFPRINQYVILPVIIILLDYFALFSQNAGVSSLPAYSACPGTNVLISLNISGSPVIASISLRIDYDGSVLSFITTENTNLDLDSSGGAISGTQSPSGTQTQPPRKLMLSWFSPSGNGSSITTNGTGLLCDLLFHFYGGSSTLVFNNSIHLGQDCEYSDSIGDALIDTPTTSYYINGSVMQISLPQMTGISGTSDPCPGSNVYTVSDSAGVAYTWSNSCGFTGNSSSNSITFTVMPSSTPGTISVYGTNVCGAGNPASIAITGIEIASLDVLTINAVPPAKCSESDSVELTGSGGIAGSSAIWSWYSGSCGGVFEGTGLSFLFSPSITTEYYLRAEGYCNITGCCSAEVVVDVSPVLSGVINGPELVNTGEQDVYSVENIPGAAYQWTAPAGWSGTGTTNSISYLIGPSSGNISVTATNLCGTSQVLSLYVTNNSGIENIEFNEFSVNIFPDPFRDFTQINIVMPSPCNVKIVIYKLNGDYVTELPVDYYFQGKYMISFNGSNLPSGIYSCITSFDIGGRVFTVSKILNIIR